MASNLSLNFHAQTSEVGEPLAPHNPLHCFFKQDTTLLSFVRVVLTLVFKFQIAVAVKMSICHLAAECVNHVVSFGNSNFTIYNIKKNRKLLQ